VQTDDLDFFFFSFLGTGIWTNEMEG